MLHIMMWHFSSAQARIEPWGDHAIEQVGIKGDGTLFLLWTDQISTALSRTKAKYLLSGENLKEWTCWFLLGGLTEK